MAITIGNISGSRGAVIYEDTGNYQTFRMGALDTAGNSYVRDGTPDRAFRNKIINGSMLIDQRGNTSSLSGSSNMKPVDRWNVFQSSATRFTTQRNLNNVVQFFDSQSYLGISTPASTFTLGTNEAYGLETVIEGYDCHDLMWGTAYARPAMLSFSVRTSASGPFGGSIATTGNTGGAVYVYPFTYNPSAGVWNRIVIRIVPPSTAATTWARSNGNATTNMGNEAGIYVRFGLGASGTRLGGTAGTWTSAGNFLQPSGTTNFVAQASATFYITDVQFETLSGFAASVGSGGAQDHPATPFERRPFSEELMLCQRYYSKSSNVWKVANNGDAYTDADKFDQAAANQYGSTGAYTQWFQLPVTMRASPSVSIRRTNLSTTNDRWSYYEGGLGWINPTAQAIQSVTQNGFNMTVDYSPGWTVGRCGQLYGAWIADAEF